MALRLHILKKLISRQCGIGLNRMDDCIQVASWIYFQRLRKIVFTTKNLSDKICNIKILKEVE